LANTNRSEQNNNRGDMQGGDRRHGAQTEAWKKITVKSRGKCQEKGSEKLKSAQASKSLDGEDSMASKSAPQSIMATSAHPEGAKTERNARPPSDRRF